MPLYLGPSRFNQVILTNDEVDDVVIGTPVYIDANSGFKRAKATASVCDAVGLVGVSPAIGPGTLGPVVMSGVLTALTAEWDAIAATVGGLTKDVRYYLDPTTAGRITATAPSTLGQYVLELGIALSSTDLKVDIKTPILL